MKILLRDINCMAETNMNPVSSGFESSAMCSGETQRAVALQCTIPLSRGGNPNALRNWNISDFRKCHQADDVEWEINIANLKDHEVFTFEEIAWLNRW